MVPVRFDSPAASQDVLARKAVGRKECEQDLSQPDPGLNTALPLTSWEVQLLLWSN